MPFVSPFPPSRCVHERGYARLSYPTPKVFVSGFVSVLK